MKILIAGASGLIGSSLSHFLRGKGHQVVQLSRHPSGEGITWNPEGEELDQGLVEGFDAIINLAGENVADGRWSNAKKKSILESRVKSTTLLARAIREMPRPPKVFINASAVGFYGDQKDQIVDENEKAGAGFLANVCKQWENAAGVAEREGVRVVRLRIGVVLSAKGGALANMLWPFKLGLGGRIGPGTQYMSWVSLNDLVHIIDFILSNETVAGAVNAVSPCPVTNAEFTRSLGKALKRPTVLPLPAFAARLVFGEVADELLLASVRVHPSKLQMAGYNYCDPSLDSFLRREVKGDAS